MQFSNSETQQLLQTTARSFLQDTFPWERLYALEDDKDQISRDDVARFAELGWMGLIAPEDAGGGGASLLEAAIVIEELGYAAVPAPVAVSNVAALVLQTAEASQQLADLVSNKRTYTLSDGVRRLRPVSAGLSASGGKLAGTLPLVAFAAISDIVLTPLTIDGEPAFAAFPLSDGEQEPVKLLDRTSYANVRFDGVALDSANVLATGPAAVALHERCDALTTALTTIELAGMMQRVLELTTEYITGRIQFGQPIAKFQAARHRAAELLMSTEMTRWAAYHALWRFQEDHADTEEVWLAKHYAARAADPVYQHSHMLHGGIGVGTDYPLHLLTQGIIALAVRGGSLNELTERAIQARGLAPAEQAS